MKLNTWILIMTGFALMTFISSCTIDTETHFNKNYSGSQVVSIDLQSFMEMMSSFGDGESADMDDMMNRLNDPDYADSLRMMEDSMSILFAGTGAENFSIAMSDEGVMSLGYDFASLETFQKIKQRSAELTKKQGQSADGFSNMMSGLIGGDFSRKGKWLSIPFGEDGMLDDMKNAMPGGTGMSGDDMEDNLGMMEGLMGSSIMFRNTYTFDRQIKKVKGDVPYIQDGNKLTVEYALSDMMKWMKEGADPIVKVKLK